MVRGGLAEGWNRGQDEHFEKLILISREKKCHHNELNAFV